ncbi:hypothetical protein [Nocardia jejuensis]|uniref:hypothetical protein n=1 Tax=Nocardia jejuensis TaxID=328049 RepID=UPI000A8401FD|nr:hypothetical protein [Nocardia jejuensis]
MRAFPSSPARTPRSTPIGRPHSAAHVRLGSAAAVNRSDVAGGPSSQPESTRLDPLRRAGLLATATTLLFSVAVVFAPSSASAASLPLAPENAGARVALMESAAAQPDPATIPADFAAGSGYEPVLEDGLLVNPHGDCSSPVTLPAEFTLACKAHDLGYDLLRYAGDHGQPLGPWARQSVDAALEQRMHAACATRPDAIARARCQVMATIATTAVDLNSIRQDYGVPIHETFFDSADSPSSHLRDSMIFALLAAAVGAAAALLRRRTRRTTPPALRAE